MILMNRIVWEIYDRQGSVDFQCACEKELLLLISGADIKIDVVWVNSYICIWYNDTLHTSIILS